MRTMGLKERLLRLIMNYVWFVTFSILINGEPQGLISPSRGLCQVDPLLPCNQCQARMRLVLRDDQGIFWFGTSIGVHELNELDEIELLAIFQGLHMCSLMGILHLQWSVTSSYDKYVQ